MAQRKKAGVSPKTIKWIWGVVFAPFALLAVMLLLTALGLFGRMPSFEELENPRSNLATEIYSEDGKVIGTFFVQNRSYVQYDELFPLDSAQLLRLDGYDVPPIIAALISTEDVRYRGHSGIDLMSLVRVGVKTVLMQNTSQGGGSTITQQLAKNLFPRDINENRGKIARTTKLVVSKLKEWITALKLEYNYTKEEIAAMYLNTVEFGSNAYGIKSAAHTFFNKEPHELNIQEAALLADYCNLDSLRLRQEVEKLAAYHGYTGKILKEDIEALVAPTVDANVFQLGDKVLRGDFNGAMAIVDDLLFLQERPESILTILTMSFVDYYRAAAVRRAGVADATARKELGYGGSYRFTKALEQCGRLSRPALEGSLEILADADARMKQSAADGRTVLEVTILRLIELLRRERA